MRLLLLSTVFLLLCSCSSGKPQYIPPPKPVEPEPVVQLAPPEPELIAAVDEAQPIDDSSFLAVLQKEGIPSENFIPRSKEQVAVYQRQDHFSFYYFQKNRLVQQKDYPTAAVEQLKTTNRYPDTILRELGAVE